MHIPGNFHFHDINKYISAILVPVLLFQNLEALIIPFTLADNVITSDIQVESELIDITDMGGDRENSPDTEEDSPYTEGG